MSKHTNPAEKPAAGWRLKLGAALFGLSIILPVLGVPLVTALGLSTTITASVSGALLVRDLYTVIADQATTNWFSPYSFWSGS